jgi:hypothetical protein
MAGNLVLKWVERDHPHEFPIPENGTITLGRSQCDITFALQTVSRKHAAITSADGRCEIENLSTVNDVILNGETRLANGQRALLSAGDRIELGPVKLAVDEGDGDHERFGLECSNCGRINAYNPEEQCKYCGRNLSNGITVMLEGDPP